MLGEDAVGDVAVDVGQAALNAVVVEGQLFVIDAHQMQHGGVEVVPLHRVLDCLPADLVGLAKAESGLHPAACESAGEAVLVVVAPGANLV